MTDKKTKSKKKRSNSSPPRKKRRSPKFKPESLLDYLLANAAHEDWLKFYGDIEEDLRFQPSEIFVEKRVPDRIFWQRDPTTGVKKLVIVDLKVRVDLRACIQIEIFRSVGMSHYVNNGPPTRNEVTPITLSRRSVVERYQEALERVQARIFSLYQPKPPLLKLLTQRGFSVDSVEFGLLSKRPLDPRASSLPLILADLNAHLRIYAQQPDQEGLDEIRIILQGLKDRLWGEDEKVFISLYPSTLDESNFPASLERMAHEVVKVIELSDSDLKTFIKKNIHVLKPAEVLESFKPEERLEGLSNEEILKVLEKRKNKEKK